MISSFYLTYAIWKSSVLYENVSTSSFNYILNIFLSSYLCSVFKIFQFYKLSYFTLKFFIDILEEIFQFKKCLHFIFFLVFRDRVPLCSPGYPGTHSVDKAELELRNPPASASQVLGLKACATTARPPLHFLIPFK